ncbi:MAG: sugar ABC transporter permease [Clostridiales bacterium]|nr:sugar ABC transporter permease [Clostridiales bacterium]
MKKKKVRRAKKSSTVYHLMLLLPMLFVFVFNYIPMGGIILAFKDYKPGLGIIGSPWVGLEHFIYLVNTPEFWSVLANTLVIALQKIIWGIIVPLTFALLLNEVRSKLFMKTVQTVTFIPYFLSWVVLGGILIEFLSMNGGMLNSLLNVLGLPSVNFLGDPNAFVPTVIVSDIWKGLGYNAVIYLAALTGVDPTLYEAAAIDGAGRWKQTLHVTLPSIAPIIALMTILSLGNVLNAGFDQIFNLYNPAVYKTGDVIDTFVYRLGMENYQYSLSTAVGLFKSVVSGILIVVSYKLADRYAGYRVF